MKTHVRLSSFFSRKVVPSIFISCMLLFSINLNAQLAGTYKLHPDSVGADFRTFAEVADTLMKSGVSDSVIINILPGVYTDVHIEIDTIEGTGPDKWVVFQSSTLDSTDVTLSYVFPNNSETNYIIRLLGGVSYVTFRHITFNATAGSASWGKVFQITDADHINFFSNIFIGKPSSYYDQRNVVSCSGQVEYVVYRYNQFDAGEKAVRHYNSSTTNLSKGNVVQYNIFNSQHEHAIYMRTQDAPVISDNFIDQNPDSKTAIWLEYCDNDLRVTNNIMQVENNKSAIYMYRCDGITNLEGLVANNMIDVYKTGDENYGIRLNSCNNQKIYHNSIRIAYGERTTSRCLYVHGGGSNIDIQNNIFANHARGYAYYIESTGAISNIDFNNYHVNGNFLVYWGGARRTMEELLGASGFDDNSISANPAYFGVEWVDGSDMHTTSFLMKNAGTDLSADVPFDIEGESRSLTPCLGADEFVTATGAALTGTITVGPSEELTSLRTVVDSMNLYGIDGPVTINLKEGTYGERIYLTYIHGADNSNRVTIQSDPSNTSNAIISSSDAYQYSDYVFMFQRGSYVSLKNLNMASGNASYPCVVWFDNYCVHDSIINCTLNTSGTTSGTAVIRAQDDHFSDIVITGCTITDAVSAIWFEGLSDINYRPRNMVISGNTLNNQYSSALYLEYCQSVVVKDNDITSRNPAYYGYGIDLRNCHGGVTVTGNNVISLDGDKGISIDNCDGSSGSESLVANNVCHTKGGGSVLANPLQTRNSDYIDLYFNTVVIHGGNSDANSSAYYNYNGSHLNVKNNIFANFGNGRAYYNEQTNALDASDYNVLISAGENIGRWGNSEKRFLEAWQTSSEMDDNSIEVNPAFVSSDDLHAQSFFLDGTGEAIPGLTVDKDGVTRSSPPDIGAYEFTSPFEPISGSFTVYGDNPDFSSLQEAMDTLQFKGMDGPVEFVVREGTWNEQRFNTVRPIMGLTKKDSLVIRGETGDPEDVILTSSETLTMFPFARARYLTIKDLTLNSTATSGGRPIAMWATTKDVKILNNRLVNSNNDWANIWFNNGNSDSILIKDNIFSKGEFGIYFHGNSNVPSTNTCISGNEFTGASNMGMYFRHHTDLVITANNIYNTLHGSFESMQLDDCHGILNVSGNKISSSNSGTAIYLNNCHATELFNGLVSNNVIYHGGSSAYGIYLNSSEYHNIYNNSVNITSSSATYGLGLYVNSSSVGIDIVNNVLANTGGGKAMQVDQSGDVLTVDNNCYFSKSDTWFVRWAGTEYTDLADLTAYTGKDGSSIEADPLFMSKSDLRSGLEDLHQAALPFAEVSHDVDSVERDPTNPDIGAYEFTCGPPVFNVWVSPTCQGDSTMIIDSSMNIAPGSTRRWDLTGNGEIDVVTENMYDTIVWFFPEAGENTLTYLVLQIAGCINEDHPVADITPAPELDIATKGSYCDTTDGWAEVTVTNLSGEFDYYWSDGQEGSRAEGLAIGTYSVAVTNETGCTTTEEVEIGEAIEVTVTQLRASTCGIADGQAVVSATGGVEPYRFVWSNGETSDTNNILSPGSHYVNVIDAQDCYAVGHLNLTSDGGPQITLESLSDNVCYGGKMGAIDISISGGVGPYSVLWSNGERTEDIDSLAAGTYDVIVEAADECLGAASFQVYQPSQISISPVVTPATCEGSDGSAVAVVSGGSKPYTYSWSTGGIYQIEEGLEAGVYSVTVTDANQCEMVEPVLVSNVSAPVVTIADVKGVGCTVTNNGEITIDVQPPSLSYDYSWTTADGSGLSPGSKNQSGLTEGTYKVTVEDLAGCKGVAQAMVMQEPPDVNPICLVTVDTASGKNMIIWEKLVTEDVAYYNVYRESSVKGSYQVIASVPANEESLYVDSLADPTIRSWRYKLSVVDDCGNESELSEHHKTMHLTMNVGLDKSVNLIWDHYEGFPIVTYEIMRYDSAGGWGNIASMPSNLTSYTDANPPKEDLTYFIEVDHPTGCTSDDKKASTLNSSKSNRQNRLKEEETGILDLASIAGFSIYPNPGPGLYNLNMDLDIIDNVSVKVFDVSGKLIMTRQYLNVPFSLSEQIDLTGYSDGIYQIHVRTSKALFHRILIKE